MPKSVENPCKLTPDDAFNLSGEWGDPKAKSQAYYGLQMKGAKPNGSSKDVCPTPSAQQASADAQDQWSAEQITPGSGSHEENPIPEKQY